MIFCDEFISDERAILREDASKDLIVSNGSAPPFIREVMIFFIDLIVNGWGNIGPPLPYEIISLYI